MGVAQNLTGGVTQVLVHVSIYQGSILGTGFLSHTHMVSHLLASLQDLCFFLVLICLVSGFEHPSPTSGQMSNSQFAMGSALVAQQLTGTSTLLLSMM